MESVAALVPELYIQWRAKQEARALLSDSNLPHPPEKLLQSVWHHQRIRRDDLRTVDGHPVRVLHPGFWNRSAGPDFRGAVLQFGHEEPRSGDVEIDLIPQNWHAHQHHTNPAFGGVILHVVWTGATEPTEQTRRMLALENFLDMPVADLQKWGGEGATAHWPESLRGACSGPLNTLGMDLTRDLLKQAAMVRFQRKARELELRARQAGWEQALWEGLFRGLGYKQNVWPMQRLAELLPMLRETNASLIAMQARLFGVSGFLPTDVSAAGLPGDYPRTLWDHWWRERERFFSISLPKTLWRMYGLRPANQPQRRLALAAHWLTTPDFVTRLENWFTTPVANANLETTLLDCLQPAEDSFWSWHWSFNSSRQGKAQPLLGEQRATDLAINIILPWFWARAKSGNSESAAATAEARYLAWPAAQDNSSLRLARQRLLGGSGVVKLNTAAEQQGLLQIIHDFCDHTNAVCDDCHFPDLVKSCVRG